MIVQRVRPRGGGLRYIKSYASSDTIGSGTKPIYMASGATLTASTSTVGSASKPVYMNAGAITPLSSTVGGTTQPVYLSAGTITAMSGALATTYGGTGTTTGHLSITLSTDTTSSATASHGGTFTAVDSVTRDSYGHVTKVNTKTITLPASDNTDTKVTNTASTSTKYYVTGSSSSSTNTGTQYFDTGVYVGTTAGMLVATTFSGALSGNATTATTLANARYFRTNLASTSSVSFNGSADVTPGVTGILGTANGGTGTSTGTAPYATLLSPKTATSFVSGGIYLISLTIQLDFYDSEGDYVENSYYGYGHTIAWYSSPVGGSLVGSIYSSSSYFSNAMYFRGVITSSSNLDLYYSYGGLTSWQSTVGKVFGQGNPTVSYTIKRLA